MLAKVVHGTMDTARVDDAARAVREEFVPNFSAQPGALRGYWMADRLSGQILIVTTWSDADALDAARSSDGAQRARIADGIGLRVHSIQSMVVVAQRDEVEVRPEWRWARATWITGDPVGAAVLPASHRLIVPDQARSAGFKGSYWLADESISCGVALSFWDGPDALTGSEAASRRRRRRLQRQFGFSIDRIHHYDGIGATAPAAIDLTAPDDTSPVDLRLVSSD